MLTISRMGSSAILISLLTLFYVSVAHCVDISRENNIELESHTNGDVFKNVLQSLDVEEYVLPVDKLQFFISRICRNFEGDDKSQSGQVTCDEASFCVCSRELISFLGGNASIGLPEELFQNASIVLLYYLTTSDVTINTTKITLDHARNHLSNLTFSTDPNHHHIHSDGIRNLLNVIKEHRSRKRHEHGEENKEDHHHDTEQNFSHKSSFAEVISKEHSGQQDISSKNSEDHHDDEHMLSKVVKPKCLSADSVFYYMNKDDTDYITTDRFGELASLVLYLIYDGSVVESKCRLLPNNNMFLGNIYQHFGTTDNNLTIEGLDSLMLNLGISPRTQSYKENQQEVATQDDLSTCFSAGQIAALQDSQSGIDQATFEKLCPVLISQKLNAKCSVQKNSKCSVSDAEKYGYGSVAIALICLTSIAGVIFIPCVSSRVYANLMSCMLGLAVGTLFADAVLHLIPSAMGVHNHGEHNNNREGIHIEKYTLHALAILGGLYLFYIIESVMTRFGHSHSHTDDDSNGSDLMTFTKMKPKKDKVDLSSCPVTSCECDVEAVYTVEKPSLSPIALMIIMGDAFHNFADGMAVGAAFNFSTSSGISTSIAIFCHELPHELGDFAVLLQNGLSFKRAALLNLLSGTTAFIGLYVGLAISSSEEVRNWIFAIAAGIFIYIALVDLLPQLIKTRSTFHFILNNVGILTGFLIMFLITLFEEHIKI